MKYLILISIIFLFNFREINSQVMLDGGIENNPHVAFGINSNSKYGMLVSYSTATSRSAMANSSNCPPDGLLVYDTADGHFYYFKAESSAGSKGPTENKGSCGGWIKLANNLDYAFMEGYKARLSQCSIKYYQLKTETTNMKKVFWINPVLTSCFSNAFVNDFKIQVGYDILNNFYIRGAVKILDCNCEPMILCSLPVNWPKPNTPQFFIGELFPSNYPNYRIHIPFTLSPDGTIKVYSKLNQENNGNPCIINDTIYFNAVIRTDD